MLCYHAEKKNEENQIRKNLKKKKKKITEREKYYTFLTGRLFLVLFYNEVTYFTCSSLVNFKTKAIFSTFAKEAEVLKII